MPDIDLARIETALLIEAVKRPEATQPFGVYVFDADHPGAELGRQVERQVFAEAFGDTPELLAAEYGEYDDASVFLVVVDHRRGLPAGAMRVILPSARRTKSLEDLERIWGLDVDGVLAATPNALTSAGILDVATLAVMPDYRGAAAAGLVSTALYQALYQLALATGADWYVAILDRPVLRMLQWQLKRLFEPFTGVDAKAYLGSASSLPVWSDLARWEARVAELDAVQHEILFLGTGLEPMLSTPDWATVDLSAVAAPAIVRKAS